jgi:hypothetical protein
LVNQGELKREATWTESLAVGSAGFVEKIKPLILTRRETEIAPAADDAWILREPASAYGQESGLKSGAKTEN